MRTLFTTKPAKQWMSKTIATLIGVVVLVTSGFSTAASLKIGTKWNLLGYYGDTGVVPVASTFNDKTKVSTVWKWNNATEKWAFFSPMLDDGGKAYAASKGYDFLTTIYSGEGFWVNANVSHTATLTTEILVGPGATTPDTLPTTTTNTTSTTTVGATTTTTNQNITSAAMVQGYYSGTFSSSGTNGFFDTIVLDNGQMWGIYGQVNPSTGFATIYGGIQANGNVINNTFTANDLRDYFYNGQIATGSLSIPNLNGATLTGTINNSIGQTITLNATMPSTNLYDYNVAAKLSDITGAWTGFSLDGTTTTINIGSNGQFTVPWATTCIGTAEISPRASGKNVFDLKATVPNIAGCGSAAGMTVNGMAVSNLRSNGTRALTMAYVNSARTLGNVFIAAR